MQACHSASGSMAEDLFIRLFSETFGAEKAGYLYSQYHFYDIYQNSRCADFLLENQGRRVVIEIDDEGFHHKGLVASGNFYKEETVQTYARQYGWTLIDDRNRKTLFLEMARRMDMSYSYKPVLIQAILRHADEKGRVKLSDISDYFRTYYERSRAAGLVVEKPDGIFTKGSYTDSEAQRNILANPFKRFEDMRMPRHTRTLGIIQVDEAVWKRLTEGEKAEIGRICEEKLEAYYQRFSEKT